MWLVLCSETDLAAQWAYHGLRVRGVQPMQLVTTEMLSRAPHWSHRLSASTASISITLSNGLTLDGRTVKGVVNRITHVPLQHLTGAPDYDYASQEYTAFFMSWLYALPAPVYNAPVAQGLCGPWRHISEWIGLASQAGLPTPYYRQTSSDQIDETKEVRRLFPLGTPSINTIVVGRHFIGPQVSNGVREGCLNLARLSGTGLLGIELAFNSSSNVWEFASATPLPDLRTGGEQLLDALASELTVSQKGGYR